MKVIKEEVKSFLSSHRWHDSHIANSMKRSRKIFLLNLLRDLNKAVGFNINIQKSIVFLHINNNWKLKFKHLPLTITSKNTVYLRINLKKYWQNFWIETYKTMLRKTKENLNQWRIIPCLWIIRSIKPIVGGSIYSKLKRFNTIPIWISADL